MYNYISLVVNVPNTDFLYSLFTNKFVIFMSEKPGKRRVARVPLYYTVTNEL